jgi:hypothetical protein
MGRSHTTFKAATQRDLLRAALAYAARGWSVIPVRRKKAEFEWKRFQIERPAQALVRDWFSGRLNGITGVAVVLGRVSGGLACRDFDRLGSYESWAAAHPGLASALPTVATGRGRHVYFGGPEGFKNLGDGEYRGDPGHYCVLPPSAHPDGPAYSWLIPLPDGDLPLIDPAEAGLRRPWDVKPCNTEDTEDTEDTEGAEDTPSAPQSLPEFSVLSVFSAPSVLQAIESTLPTSARQRHRRLFELARHLKAIPSLASADPATLRPVVAEWHRRALPVIRTKDFTATWGEFLVAWDRVQVPAGQGAVEEAFRRAVKSGPPAEAAALYEEPPVLLLAGLCRELQRIAGDGPFYLDCRTAGRLVEIPHTTAWRLMTVVFVSDGILAPGAKGSQASGKANEYRYLGD